MAKQKGRDALRKKATKVYHLAGEGIAGERIIAEAREIGEPVVVPGSSAHRIQEIVLKRNALCVIDRPFEAVDKELRLRES